MIDELGNRMKTCYEDVSNAKLMRKTPVVVRIDGKAFHTFTKDFKKPFDEILLNSMQDTMKYLCENIQGCIFGYTQSDEINLIVIDYQTPIMSAYFNYDIQDMCSVISSMATMAFNRVFSGYATRLGNRYDNMKNPTDEDLDYCETIESAARKGAIFNCRIFNITKDDTVNYFIWRQLDSMRKSIHMFGRVHFSHKELINKSSQDIKDMLINGFNVNWDSLPTEQKYGSACLKTEKGWKIDKDMPIINEGNEDYINKLVFIGN